MNESDFKKWVRNNWDGWIESYEPRRGTGIGIPDIQLVINKRLVPVELKVGEFHNDLLVAREVRPAQIIWHKKINEVGIRTLLLIGVYDHVIDDWFAYPIDGRNIGDWRKGYIVKDPLSDINLSHGLLDWCCQLLKT